MDLELQGWEAVKKKDKSGLGHLIADDALDVGEYGIWDKTKSVESISSVDLTEYSLSDWKFRKASDDVVIVTYKATQGMSAGQPIPPVEYVSAIWAHRGDTWVNLLSQDTPASPSNQ